MQHSSTGQRPDERIRGVHGRRTLYWAAPLCAMIAVASMCRTSTASSDDSPRVIAADTGAEISGTSAGNVFAGAKLFVTQDSPFREQAAAWRRSRPADAAVMDVLATRPQAIWLGEWNEDISRDVSGIMRAAAADRSLPVFVIYFIPLRDCGSYSRGGAVSAAFYREWTSRIETAIGSARAAVILEPDALAGMDCLTSAQRTERVTLIREAVEKFARHANIGVYVDAGNARWKEPEEMATALRSVNVAAASGFALNISNFFTTEESVAYGEKISSAIGDKHFLIDTSRNGLGPTADLAWCNPPGRALGARPSTTTGHARVDALLWVKRPGESDGECNGGPAAGVWWPEYALGLARRAGL